MSYSRIEITKEQIIEAIENTSSMISAARYLNVSRDKFNKFAKLYGLFKPNQSGKDIRKKRFYTDEELFSNRTYKIAQTVLIKRLKEIRDWKCEICGLNEWMGKTLPLEVHHIDGNNYNNELSNLQILCPNCHSLTDNWRSRNKKGYDKTNPKVTDNDILKALDKYKNISRALTSLGLVGGSNYNRVYKLLKNMEN